MGCIVAQLMLNCWPIPFSWATFLLSSHPHTAIDGVTFQLKDQSDTQQNLVKVNIVIH